MISTGAIFFLKAQPSNFKTQGIAQNPQESARLSPSTAQDLKTQQNSLIVNPPSPPQEIELQRKAQVLREIFASHNDNDPRLDQEFNHLSSAEKLSLAKIYRETPAEKLNDRGILVLILSRNLESPNDFQFIDELFRELACLSLTDCRRPPSTQTDDHGELSSAVTLNYPQLVALEKLKEWPEHHLSADEKTKSAWKNSVNEAQHSQSEIIAREARKL